MVFDFDSYKQYLAFDLDAKRETKGYKANLAKAIACHRSFVPQVLKTHINLTLDQAAALCEFWHFSDLEADYFLALVNLERAGTISLQRMIHRKLDTIREQRKDLATHFPKSRKLTAEIQAKYYSDWRWVAIHVLSSIAEYSRIEALAERLQISPSLVKQTLEDLSQMGLVSFTDASTWTVKERDVYLPKQSHLTNMNHINWRQRGIHSLQKRDEFDFHYTNVHALSKKDVERVKQEIVNAIRRMKAIVDPSPEEDAVCFTCDLFRV